MPAAKTQPEVEEFEPRVAERIEAFEELSFTFEEAKRLAVAKNSDGFPIRIYEVEKALKGGCKHAMAVRIFT
jgi:hypothetical protein